MRKVLVTFLTVMLFAHAARAQTIAQVNEAIRTAASSRVLVGVGVLAVGALVTSTSNETIRVTSPIGTTESSPRSVGQLAAGLVIAGAGGVVLWSGVQERRVANSKTTLEVSVSKRSGGVFVRSRW